MYFDMNSFILFQQQEWDGSLQVTNNNNNNNNEQNNEKSQQSGGPVAPLSHVLLLALTSLLSKRFKQDYPRGLVTC